VTAARLIVFDVDGTLIENSRSNHGGEVEAVVPGQGSRL
jgi:hypothetical protein